MKIICFYGEGNSGKTEIIKKVLNDFFHIKLIRGGKDFSLFFDYKGKKIGICSCGDKPSEYERWLKPLKEANCDIIICANHTKKKNFGKLLFYFNEGDIEKIECKGNKNSPLNFQEEDNTRRIREFESIFNSLMTF